MKTLIFAALSCTLALSGCAKHQPKAHGYISTNLVNVSSTQAGELIKLNVSRGQQVKKGQLLFRIESQPEADDFKSALYNLKQAQATLANLQVGDRPSELAGIKANINKAQAELAYSRKNLQRDLVLVRAGNISNQAVDTDIKNTSTDLATLNNLKASYVTAAQPGRVQQIDGARAAAQASQASLKKAKWALLQTAVRAPRSGEVFDRYYYQGEQVPATHPVLALLVPSETKVTFFVPEPLLSGIKPGKTVTLSCDNCAHNLKASISFISSQAEYTPPVIYSRESQSKLVYLVKARLLGKAKRLHPGQPIGVNW
jgi:HlyD family secretion protein